MSENCVTLVPSAHSNSIFFKITLASCHLKSLPVAFFTSTTLISSPVQNVTGKWSCFSLRQERCVSDSGEIFRENYHYEISAFPSVLQTSPTLPPSDHRRYNDQSSPGASYHSLFQPHFIYPYLHPNHPPDHSLQTHSPASTL
jgi:hypothetical protein